MKAFTKQKGVTLIEVLVSIIITSIGILGFASLQFLGLNSNQSGYLRSQATFIATDLSERMRANIDGMNDNEYADVTITSSTLACVVPANPCDERNNAGTVMAASACTAEQRADHDIFIAGCGYASNEYANQSEKTNFLGDLLPNGVIRIQCIDSVPAPGDTDPCTDFSDHTITISWFELDEETTNGKLSYNDDAVTAGSSAVKSIVYTVRL